MPGGFREDLIPIGTDAGGELGNQICIGLHGGRRGRIYLWVHDSLLGVRDPHSENVYLAAESFEGFIGKLMLYED